MPWWQSNYDWVSNPGAAQAAAQRTNAAAAAAYRGGIGTAGSSLAAGGAVPYGDLASRTNALMTSEALRPYMANLPGYTNLVGQASNVTGSQLLGEIPEDVKRNLAISAAERGTAHGIAPGPNSNAALMRALGLTSIGLQQQGMQGLHQLIADTPVPELFNPASLFVPEHLAGMELNAANAGLRTGGGGAGGAGGYSTIRLPGGSLGSEPLGTPSWNRQPAQQVFGGTGPLGTSYGGRTYYGDEQPGMFNSNSFVNGMFVGPGGGAPAGNTRTDWWNSSGGAGDYGPPAPRVNITTAPQGFNTWGEAGNFLNDLESDFAGIDFGSDYSPFGEDYLY